MEWYEGYLYNTTALFNDAMSGPQLVCTTLTKVVCGLQRSTNRAAFVGLNEE